MKIISARHHERRSLHRRMTIAAITALLTLSIESCNIGGQGQKPEISFLSAQSVAAFTHDVSAQDLEDASLERLSTESGTLFISTPHETSTSQDSSERATTLVSRDPSTDQFQWAVSVKPVATVGRMPNSIEDSEHGYETTVSQSASGDILVSPDGRLVSLVLKPDESTEGKTSAELTTHIVVLDTKTGKRIRTVSVSGIVLGQALANQALAVETAQNYFPAGSGKGKITVFSLADTNAKPSSFPTDKWLVGASGKDLILAQDLLPFECRNRCTPYTVTRTSTDGNAIENISGVTAVRPGGWLSRYTDPKTASSLVLQIAERPKNVGTLQDSLQKLPTQLINLNTGQTLDTTDMIVDERSVPHGPGLVVYQIVRTEKSTEHKPQFWLSSADDGHPHTENLEQFKNN